MTPEETVRRYVRDHGNDALVAFVRWLRDRRPTPIAVAHRFLEEEKIDAPTCRRLLERYTRWLYAQEDVL